MVAGPLRRAWSSQDYLTKYPGYRVPFAEKVRSEAGVRTIALGMIRTYEQAEEVVSNGRADLVAIGRGFLRYPYLLLRWAKQAGLKWRYPSSTREPGEEVQG